MFPFSYSGFSSVGIFVHSLFPAYIPLSSLAIIVIPAFSIASTLCSGFMFFISSVVSSSSMLVAYGLSSFLFSSKFIISSGAGSYVFAGS